MADENDLAEQAHEVLGELAAQYRGQPLGNLSSQLTHQLFPRMAFDTNIEERQREYERVPKEFIEEVKAIAKKRGPTYQTPVFKCQGDYDKCLKHTGSSGMCMFLLIVCVGKHLIPFAPKGT
jgi:hypothetical protein